VTDENWSISDYVGIVDVDQAFPLKFRLLSINFTSEEFETGRKMSAMGIFQQLTVIERTA
jgi:hypothetical protein